MSARNAILILIAIRSAVLAQPAASALRFEVASVKPTLDQTEYISQSIAAGKTSGGGMRVSGLRVDIDSMTMKSLISTAYRIDVQRMVAPGWINDGEASFAVHAVMPQGATKEQISDMLRALLEERFHMEAHRASIEQTAYALVVGKNGPKLKKPGDVDRSTCDQWTAAAGPVGSGNQICRTTQMIGDRRVSITMMTNSAQGPLLSSSSSGEAHSEYFRITMPKLAELLTQGLSTGAWLGAAPLSFVPVVDRTGIEGDWDVVLDTTGGQDERLASYSASLEKQGIRLERITAPVEKLIIDTVDRVPTEN